MEKVAVNNFVRRQVKSSGKTYACTLSFADIAAHAEAQLAAGNHTPGYRDGVIIVDATADIAADFVCPFTRINEGSELEAKVVRRRLEEDPYIRIRVVHATPLPAGKVQFVLYRQDVLAETNEQSTTADWELISIHALPEGVAELPMNPVTMMRNQLQRPGGTRANYASADWAEAIYFWQQYAAIEP